MPAAPKGLKGVIRQIGPIGRIRQFGSIGSDLLPPTEMETVVLPNAEAEVVGKRKLPEQCWKQEQLP
ncbi:MAG: hypothetical protein AMXMBFR13_23740 [Phycisphaerae bacterium]